MGINKCLLVIAINKNSTASTSTGSAKPNLQISTEMEATGRNPAKPIITDDFPPHAWLGWSLDMTSVTPADITSVHPSYFLFWLRLLTSPQVANSVLKTSQLIEISKNSHQQSFGSAGITWDVPDNVNATDQVQDGEGR
jgi:hypothetical protein